MLRALEELCVARKCFGDVLRGSTSHLLVLIPSLALNTQRKEKNNKKKKQKEIMMHVSKFKKFLHAF